MPQFFPQHSTFHLTNPICTYSISLDSHKSPARQAGQNYNLLFTDETINLGQPSALLKLRQVIDSTKTQIRSPDTNTLFITSSCSNEVAFSTDWKLRAIVKMEQSTNTCLTQLKGRKWTEEEGTVLSNANTCAQV